MKVNFKAIAIESVDIPDEIAEIVLQRITAGEITSANQLFGEYGYVPELHYEIDAAYQMPLDFCNQGQATIEVTERIEDGTNEWKITSLYRNTSSPDTSS